MTRLRYLQAEDSGIHIRKAIKELRTGKENRRITPAEARRHQSYKKQMIQYIMPERTANLSGVIRIRKHQ